MEEDDRVEDEFYDALGSSGARSASKKVAIVSSASSAGMMTSLNASRANSSSSSSSSSGGSKSADAIKSEYKQYWLKHRAGAV
jgi:hypothetical protein